MEREVLTKDDLQKYAYYKAVMQKIKQTKKKISFLKRLEENLKFFEEEKIICKLAVAKYGRVQYRKKKEGDNN